MTKPRVTITGACGLLGAHFMAACAREFEVTGLDRHDWWGDQPAHLVHGDLRDSAFRKQAIGESAPDLLIHCAAMVDVDACERDPAAAYEMNATVTADLTRLAGPKCHVVYIATDSLFRGDRALLPETEPPCPRTVYARSKLHGEWNVQLGAATWLIARTNFYGWSSGIKRTFGEWLHGALSRGEPITLFDDAYFTPIYVADLVASVLALVRGGHTGVYNAVGSERLSKYRFGMMLAELAGMPTTNVTRGSVASAGLAAERPKDMSLDSARLAHALGRSAPDAASSLRRFLADRTRVLSERSFTAHDAKP